MNFYAFSALFNSGLLIIAQAVLIFNWKKNKSIKYFCLFNTSALIWAISYFFWQISADYAQALFWVKMLMVGAILAAPTFLHFSAVIINKTKQLLIPVIIFYLLGFFSIFVNFTSSQYIAGLETKLGIPFFPTAGIYYYYYLIQWFVCLIIGFALLFIAWKKTKMEEKEFLGILTITTLISFLCAAVNYFLWFDILIPPVTTTVVAAYGVAVSFLLLKNKFQKLNLFYFEFFAIIAILVSLLNFFLGQKNTVSINLTVISIVILSAYFLIQTRVRERRHLEKIENLNHALNTSLENIINSISENVLIVSRKLNIIKANNNAMRLFGYQEKTYPPTFFDFARGKINQALVYALDLYFEDGTARSETEMLIPQRLKLTLSFSPFTMEKENDAVVILIKTRPYGQDN